MHSNPCDIDALAVDSSSNTRQSLESMLAGTSDVFEFAPAPFVILSLEGLVLSTNRSARELLGLAKNQIEGHSFGILVHADDRDLFAFFLVQALQSIESVKCELRFQFRDAPDVWAELIGNRSECENKPILLVNFRDIAERRDYETSLRVREDQFAYALEATCTGIWAWEIASGEIHVNPQCARLLGYEPHEIPKRVEFFTSLVHSNDAARFENAKLAHFEGRTTDLEDDVRLKTKSGQYRWFSKRGTIVERDDAGKPLRMVGIITDITQRRRAEESLKDSQARTRMLIEATSVGTWDWNVETNDVHFSPEWKMQLGYADHELSNHADEWKSRLHPEDKLRVSDAMQEFLSGTRDAYSIEFRLLHRDGSWRWIMDRGHVQRSADGRPTRLLGSHVDITDRKEIERNSIHSMSLMRATLESTADGILFVNLDGKFEIFNQRFREMCGIPDKLLEIGQDDAVLQFFTEQTSDPEQFIEKVRYLYAHPEETSFDTIYLKDGRVFDRYTCPQVIDEKVVGRVWNFRDVTEQRLAEAAQAEALGRLQKIASRVPGVVYQFRRHPDGTATIPYASEGMKEFFSDNEFELWKNADVTSKIIDSAAFSKSIADSARDMTPWVHEFQVKCADGKVRWVAGNSVPDREPDGSIIWHGFITDVTDRKLAEAKLRQSEKSLREAQAISQIGNFYWCAETQIVTWSDELYRIYERDPANFEPTFDSYVSAIHPDDRQRVVKELQLTMQNLTCFDHDYRIISADGGERWVKARGNAVIDVDGNLRGLEGTCQDITEQKKVEATTASLEAQLRESQKMEAIGTLAGGIAHDFNNILTSILGNVEFALPESEGGSPTVQKCLAEIRRAGERARDLVQQILSFSRRQPTNRKPISLVPVIEETAKLLSATLSARLNLEIECDQETPWVLADATQIEQVVLNLATNSMQALNGKRGSIRVRLDSAHLDDKAIENNSNLRSISSSSVGPVVRLSVRDDGPGMSAETLNRIFEPFFTTKATDQGTGLGLAVVHGIVKGHEGTVTVESQLGAGAKFTVYLPAVERPEETETPSERSSDTATEALPSQHILCLDDDEGVLTVAELLLTRQGYRVSAFSSHAEALSTLRSNPSDFDLVITDYNMPGMHGLEFAREIRSICPDLPVIISSGYVDPELTAGAAECGIQELVSKPFRITELYAVVQRVLSR